MANEQLREGFPPSLYIKEELDDRGMSIAALAEAMGFSLARVDGFMSNRRRMTRADAMMVGQVLGTGPEVWINLQKAWDEWQEQPQA